MQHQTRVGLWAVLITVGVVILGDSFVFIRSRSDDSSLSCWVAAWCSVSGVAGKSHELLAAAPPGEIGRGAALALRCSQCHGPDGIRYANSPNLAGQYAGVIYKQLQDYKSGVRTNAIMNAMAASLTDDDMRELAYYYASLRGPGGGRASR